MTARKQEGTGNWQRAQYHIIWRIRFGRCYGPVVRQTTWLMGDDDDDDDDDDYDDMKLNTADVKTGYK